jgi:tetratricopeptide (TPR) repeat protein
MSEHKLPPEGGRPAAERQFVGREEFVAPVQTALKEPPRTKPLVLVYHGGAGIGKSRLRRELVRQLARDPDVLTATLDFSVISHQHPETALFFLRRTLYESHHVRFPSFDLAYSVYWQKTHPDTALRSEEGGERSETGPESESDHKDTKAQVQADESGMQTLLEPGSLLSRLLDESGQLPLIGLIPQIARLAAASLESSTPRPLDSFLSDWWERRGERELEDLPQMEPGEIVDRLPMLWASDLKDYLGAASRKPQATEARSDDGPEPKGRSQEPEAKSGVTDSSLVQNDGRSTTNEERGTRRAVLFIDSYEKLWETRDGGQDTVGSRQGTDAWVRELVMQLPEVLWVICGRQKLRWEEEDKDWGNALSQHLLEALPEKSARKFLETCDITDEQVQDAVVKGSQGVPHYLNLAVDAMQSAKGRVQNADFRGTNPDEVVEEFARRLDKPEVETLKVLSAARFWYYGLFENLINQYQTGYPVTGYDDLARFSFVKEGAEPGTRTMHELMREALQENQPPELRKSVHLFLHEYYAKQLDGLDVKNITERHQVALTEAFYHGTQSKNAAELWPWFKRAIDVFDLAGRSRLLLPLYREIFLRLEAELGPNHRDLVEPLCLFASTVRDETGSDEAEPLYRRVLALAEKEYGPEHPLVLDCIAGLVLMCQNVGQLEEAETLCRRGVAQFDRPDAEAFDRAESLRLLGRILGEEGKYSEAEEALRRALAIFDEVLATRPEQPRSGSLERDDHWQRRCANDCIMRLAGVLQEQGRFAEAEPLARRGLEMNVEALGMRHWQTAADLQKLAGILLNLGRYTEAEPLSRQAVQLRQQILGPHNDATAVAVNNLSALLVGMGRYSEAEPLQRSALALYERKKGPDHVFTFRMANRLALILAMLGKYDESEGILLKAIASREQRDGPHHRETAKALHTAGMLYSTQGRYAEADGFLCRAVEIRSKVCGPEHPETLESLSEKALLEQRQGSCTEAETHWRDILEKRERILGPEHPDVADTANRLAGLCCPDGRFAEAEALYRRAHAIREKVFGPDNPFTAETLEGLVKVCEQTGRAAEAQELSARAQRIRAQAASAGS